jgi:hypothetical protein
MYPAGGEESMKELVFALQFKGEAHPVEGAEGRRDDRGRAGPAHALTPKGVQAKAESKPGPHATFESEVRINRRGRVEG